MSDDERVGERSPAERWDGRDGTIHLTQRECREIHLFLIRILSRGSDHIHVNGKIETVAAGANANRPKNVLRARLVDLQSITRGTDLDEFYTGIG